MEKLGKQQGFRLNACKIHENPMDLLFVVTLSCQMQLNTFVYVAETWLIIGLLLVQLQVLNIHKSVSDFGDSQRKMLVIIQRSWVLIFAYKK